MSKEKLWRRPAAHSRRERHRYRSPRIERGEPCAHVCGGSAGRRRREQGERVQTMDSVHGGTARLPR